MKKLLILLCACSLLTACPSPAPTPAPTPTPVPTTTLPPTPTPAPTPLPEPADHHAPAAVSPDGQKMGKCVLVSQGVSLYVPSGSDFGKDPACPASASAGQSCTQSCQKSDGSYLQCHAGMSQFECWGWVVDEDIATHEKVPLAGVGVDLFNFAGCIVGDCSPHAGPVVTDQWGYWDFKSGDLMDTIRLHAPAGYYGICNGRTPMEGGGTYINGSTDPKWGMLNQPIGPFQQHKLLSSSCQLNVPHAMLAKTASAVDKKAEAIRLYKLQIQHAELNPAAK